MESTIFINEIDISFKLNNILHNISFIKLKLIKLTNCLKNEIKLLEQIIKVFITKEAEKAKTPIAAPLII